MRGFLIGLLILSSTGHARAHLGFENHTEVRIYPDRMRLVVRTSIPLAWVLLGGRAPALADEAGKAAATPLLIEAAPALFSVSAGGMPIAPMKANCLFEVHDDVAFILTYARPVEWPLVLEARFFTLLGELDTGTIAVFDQTESRFSSDVEPLATKTISRGDPALSFSFPAPVASPPPPPPAAPPPISKPDHGPVLAILATVAAIALIGFSIIRGWKWNV